MRHLESPRRQQRLTHLQCLPAAANPVGSTPRKSYLPCRSMFISWSRVTMRRPSSQHKRAKSNKTMEAKAAKGQQESNLYIHMLNAWYSTETAASNGRLHPWLLHWRVACLDAFALMKGLSSRRNAGTAWTRATATPHTRHKCQRGLRGSLVMALKDEEI